MSSEGTVLYDAPGPKARALYRVLSVVVGVVLVVIAYVVYRALDSQGQLTAAKWDPFLESSSWTTYLIPGIRGTLVAAALSIVLALILGAILASAACPSIVPFGWCPGSSSNCSARSPCSS